MTYLTPTAGAPTRSRRRRSARPRSAGDGSEQLDEQGVGEQESRLGEARAISLLEEQPLFLPRCEEPGQAPVGLERDALAEPGSRDAVRGAEPEDEALGQPLPLGQGLV